MRTKLAEFFSILLDGGIGKTQGKETTEAAFFRSEETGKAKPNPFGTTGTHDGAVNHDGIIVLGGMKLQHHLASHWNALVGAYPAPPKRQVREYPLNNDTLARIKDGANLCRVLNRDSIIVAARIRLELAEEGSKAMRTELASDWINGQGAEQVIGHASSWCQFRFRSPTLWTVLCVHGRTSLP